MAASMDIPITVIVLTFNEARNLETCLRSVSWARAIFVVDSGSRDGTVELAGGLGATVVSHPFETHARQWKWALSALPVPTSWVLAIDADQVVSEELAGELRQMFAGGGPGVAGVYLNRRQIFRGRWIKHGGYYPKYLLKLFRLDAVTIDETELVDHHFAVRGETMTARCDLVEDNRNEARISVWIEKHNRYAVLQALQEFDAGTGRRAVVPGFDGSPDGRTRRMKARWAHLPLVVRPCLYFAYRYVFQLGFLDGREGFIFHVLHAFWYRLLVDINLLELRAPATDRLPTPSTLDERSRR